MIELTRVALGLLAGVQILMLLAVLVIIRQAERRIERLKLERDEALARARHAEQAAS